MCLTELQIGNPEDTFSGDKFYMKILSFISQ